MRLMLKFINYLSILKNKCFLDTGETPVVPDNIKAKGTSLRLYVFVRPAEYFT